MVILTPKGSYAEKYAKANNIQVDDIDSAKIVSTACEVCGTVLMKDSGFCHKCGAKVVAKPFVSIE